MLELNSSLVNALLVLSGGAFAMILRLIHSHSVYLYGHRLHSERHTTFRIAIQNAENVPLDGCFRAELICGAGGAFAKRPEIYAGPRGMRGELADGDRRYVLEFDQIPAYDTWLIFCELRSDLEDDEERARATSDSLAGITLRLREIDEDGEVRQRRLRRISVDQLVMSADDSLKVVGRARKPLIPLAITMVFLASAAYVLTAAFWVWSAGSPEKPSLQWPWDFLVLVGIIAMVSFFMVNAAPPPARSIQGYLDETQVSRRIPAPPKAPQTT